MFIHSNNKHLALAVLGLVGFSSPVMAEQPAPQWTFDVGVGALNLGLPFKAVESKSVVLPFVAAKYGNWSFGVQQLVGYDYKLDKDWSFKAGLNYRSDSYDDDGSFLSFESDDPVFDGYRAPDGELVLSGGLKWKFASIVLGQDILDNSGATSAQINFDLPLYRGDKGFRIKGSVGLDWYSDDYVNHNYGIEGEQIDLSVGRSGYHGDAASNYYLSLMAMYPFNREWNLMAIAKRTKLDDSIVNSPLVDSDHDHSVILALTYRM